MPGVCQVRSNSCKVALMRYEKGLVTCHFLIFSKVLYKDVGNNFPIWTVMNFQDSQFQWLLFCHQYMVISIVITLFLKITKKQSFLSENALCRSDPFKLWPVLCFLNEVLNIFTVSDIGARNPSLLAWPRLLVHPKETSDGSDIYKGFASFWLKFYNGHQWDNMMSNVRSFWCSFRVRHLPLEQVIVFLSPSHTCVSLGQPLCP